MIIYIYLYTDRIFSLCHWFIVILGWVLALAQLLSHLKTPPVFPQMPMTTLLCLGPQGGIWCHYFLARASGRAWARGSAWRACQRGRAPVRSSRLKKVV